jgi:hypothetical protein
MYFEVEVYSRQEESSGIVILVLRCYYLVLAMMWPFSSNSASSSAIVKNRLDALRTAESKLLEYAKSRFLNPADSSVSNIRFELFDTPIDIPSVIRRHDDASGPGNSVAMVIPDMPCTLELAPPLLQIS